MKYLLFSLALLAFHPQVPGQFSPRADKCETYEEDCPRQPNDDDDGSDDQRPGNPDGPDDTGSDEDI